MVGESEGQCRRRWSVNQKDMLVNSWLLEKKMCCIIETMVRRDRSGKWCEHGRRARVIYNLETLETKEPKTGF